MNNGFKEFISDDYYSDFELIDRYLPFVCRKNEKFFYKKVLNIHMLTDEIYNYKLENFYKFYGYCPMNNNEFYDHTECHACNYLDTSCMRCMHRFRNLQKDRVSEVIAAEYDRDGRIISMRICVDGKIRQYKLEELPYYTKSIMEFAKKRNDIKVARFTNVNSRKTVQLNSYDLNYLLKKRKCLGKLCDGQFGHASPNKYEIGDWYKTEWLLTWFK